MKGLLTEAFLLFLLGMFSWAFETPAARVENRVIGSGRIQARFSATERIPLPPLLGALALTGGAMLTVDAASEVLRKVTGGNQMSDD